MAALLVFILPGYLFWIFLNIFLRIFKQNLKLPLKAGYESILSLLIFSVLFFVLALKIKHGTIKPDEFNKVLELKLIDKNIVLVESILAFFFAFFLSLPYINKLLTFMFQQKDDSSARSIMSLAKKSPFWLFTMGSGKVYVAVPETMDGYPEESGSFYLKVLGSGYRDQSTKEVCFSYRYFDYIDIDENDLKNNMNTFLLVPEREIVSISSYDLEKYPILLEGEKLEEIAPETTDG